MADSTVKTILSICATTKDRVKDLVIKDAQLIFVQDGHKIAFDFGGKRVFYNQIVELNTEQERKTIVPSSGEFYFIIETAVLWRYESDWIQITTPPEEIVFIGTELPELGSKKTLYINKQNKNISVWDEGSQDYIVVGEKTNSITINDIETLFN